MSVPEVSVVMGVRNGAAELPATVASVLAQQGVELELVVVDDGSTDATPEILASFGARDPRLRVLRQEAGGLTAALVRGCAEARAPLVARQDAGDLSPPGRLQRQVAALREQASVVLASCWTEVVAPGGERLRIERGDCATDRPVPMFAPGNAREWVGPTHHGSAMFLRSTYEAVGGYRTVFALGQDWDLWLRLGERGDFLMVGEALYRRRLGPESLSLRFRPLQHALGDASSEASRLRRAGESEGPALERARELSAEFLAASRSRSTRWSAAGYYHVGEALRCAGYPSAARYLGQAVRRDPFFARAWVRWLQALLFTRARSEPAR